MTEEILEKHIKLAALIAEMEGMKADNLIAELNGGIPINNGGDFHDLSQKIEALLVNEPTDHNQSLIELEDGMIITPKIDIYSFNTRIFKAGEKYVLKKIVTNEFCLKFSITDEYYMDHHRNCEWVRLHFNIASE